VVWPHRVLDPETVDVEEVDAHRDGAPVGSPAGEQRGDETVRTLIAAGIVPVGVSRDRQAGAPPGAEEASGDVGVGIRGVPLGGELADEIRYDGWPHPEAAGDLFRREAPCAKLTNALDRLLVDHQDLVADRADGVVRPRA
jgi:hypothetical protein